MGAISPDVGVSDATAKEILGGAMACFLLLLYLGTVGYMIVQVVICGHHSGCAPLQFAKGLLFIVTTVGGLVSALVVARLALATPGGAIQIANASTDSENPLANVIAWGYVGSWFLIGIAALVIGVLMYPDVSQTVADFGTAWLGLAVTACYAYLGIDPKQNRNGG